MSPARTGGTGVTGRHRQKPICNLYAREGASNLGAGKEEIRVTIQGHLCLPVTVCPRLQGLGLSRGGRVDGRSHIRSARAKKPCENECWLLTTDGAGATMMVSDDSHRKTARQAGRDEQTAPARHRGKRAVFAADCREGERGRGDPREVHRPEAHRHIADGRRDRQGTWDEVQAGGTPAGQGQVTHAGIVANIGNGVGP